MYYILISNKKIQTLTGRSKDQFCKMKHPVYKNMILESMTNLYIQINTSIIWFFTVRR